MQQPSAYLLGFWSNKNVKIKHYGRGDADVGVDIKGTHEWYEDKSKGLGVRFISELEHAYEAISYFPHTWVPFEH